MSLPPTAWFSPCRRALSYWLVLFISARGNRSKRPTAAGGPAFPPRNGTRPCTEKGQHRLLFPLLFVRCDVCCCGAVAPRVTAALLGRFLPRLGPLATASGPFFCLRLLCARGQRRALAMIRRPPAKAGWFVQPSFRPGQGSAPRRRSGHASDGSVTKGRRVFIPPPPGRAATPGSGAQQGAPPASPGRRPDGRKRAYARTAARPYRAHG